MWQTLQRQLDTERSARQALQEGLDTEHNARQALQGLLDGERKARQALQGQLDGLLSKVAQSLPTFSLNPEPKGCFSFRLRLFSWVASA